MLICCWRPNYHNESHMALPQAMRQRIHGSFRCLLCCSCRVKRAGRVILKPSQCTSSHPMAGMLLVPQGCPHPSITAANEPQVVPNGSKGPFVSFSTKEEKEMGKEVGFVGNLGCGACISDCQEPLRAASNTLRVFTVYSVLFVPGKMHKARAAAMENPSEVPHLLA